MEKNYMKSLNLNKAVPVLLSLMLTVPAYAAKTGSDAQSAQILSTIAAIDQNEILLAVQATNKSPSSDVMGFAKMMIDDHGKNLGEALALADKIHAVPVNPNPDNLHNKGTTELVTLAALDGDKFSSAYVDAMVAGHEAALKLIDTKLMNAAKNDELKTFLTDTRAAVAHHLDEAKKLQESMKS
jgi:putative membrane protein